MAIVFSDSFNGGPGGGYIGVTYVNSLGRGTDIGRARYFDYAPNGMNHANPVYMGVAANPPVFAGIMEWEGTCAFSIGTVTKTTVNRIWLSYQGDGRLYVLESRCSEFDLWGVVDISPAGYSVPTGWNYIEFGVLTTNTAIYHYETNTITLSGCDTIYEVRVNEEQVLQGTFSWTSNSPTLLNTGWTRVGCVGYGAGYEAQYDDWYVATDGFYGDIHNGTHYPTPVRYPQAVFEFVGAKPSPEVRYGQGVVEYVRGKPITTMYGQVLWEVVIKRRNNYTDGAAGCSFTY
jgi:hypothetical protein